MGRKCVPGSKSNYDTVEQLYYRLKFQTDNERSILQSSNFQLITKRRNCC